MLPKPLIDNTAMGKELYREYCSVLRHSGGLMVNPKEYLFMQAWDKDASSDRQAMATEHLSEILADKRQAVAILESGNAEHAW